MPIVIVCDVRLVWLCHRSNLNLNHSITKHMHLINVEQDSVCLRTSVHTRRSELSSRDTAWLILLELLVP